MTAASETRVWSMTVTPNYGCFSYFLFWVLSLSFDIVDKNAETSSASVKKLSTVGLSSASGSTCLLIGIH